MNGYAPPSANPIALATSSGSRSDSARTSDRESDGKSTKASDPSGLGSKRTHVYDPARTAPSPPQPPPPLPAGAAPPVPPKSHGPYPSTTTHRAHAYTRSHSDSEYRQMNGIVPGAAPQQRFVPPPPRWPAAASTTVNGPNGSHRVAPGSMNGWGDPIGNQWASTSAATAIPPPPPIFDDVPDHLASAAAFVSGYATGLGSGYDVFTGGPYATTYDDRANQQIRSSPTPMEEGGTEGLGLMNVPAPRQPGSVSPEEHDTLRRRNASFGVVGPTMTARDTPGPQNGPGRHGMNAGAERHSISSWGTVEAVPGNVRESTMSDWGLIGLQSVAVPGSTTQSLLTTPVRLGQENGFMGADPMPHREDEEDEDEDEEEELSERFDVVSRGRNPVSGADGPRRRSHRRDSRRYDSRTQVESNSPSHTIRDGSVVRAGRSSGESGNALALDFNPSLSSLDLNSTRSHSPPLSVTHHSQITAPTPIVSRGNIMSTWTIDN